MLEPRIRPSGWGRQRSLRLELALLLAWTVSLLLVGLLVIVAIWEESDIRSRVDTQLLAASEQTQAVVGATMVRQLYALAMLAADPGLVGHVERGDLDALSRQLEALASANPDISRLAVIDADGHLIANSASDKSAVGRDFSDQPYVRLALMEGRPAVGTPRISISRMVEVPVLPLGAPIRAADGRVIGVLQSTTQLADLAPIWTGLRIGEGGFVSVLAADGTVIVHRDPARALQAVAEPAAALLDPADPWSAYRALVASQETYFVRDTTVELTGWRVRAQIPAREPFADLWRQCLGSIVVSTCLAALAAVIGVRASRRISAPIEALTQAVERVQVSDEIVALPPSHLGELRRLAAAFEAMQERLHLHAQDQVAAEAALCTQAEHLALLTQVNQSMVASLSPDAVWLEITRAAATLLSAPVSTIWDMDEAAQALRVRAVSDDAYQLPLDVPQVRVGESVVGWAAAYRQILLIDDVEGDDRILNPGWWRKHGLTSVMALPVLDGAKVVAVITVQNSAPFQINADDQDILAMFVSQAAVAVRNARLFEAEQAARLRAEATEQQFGALIDAAPDGVLMVEPSGTVLIANQAIARMTGRSLDEIVGQPATMLVDPSCHPALQSLVMEAMAAPDGLAKSGSRVLKSAHIHGLDIPLEISMSAVKTVSGIRRISVVRDVSERQERDRQRDELLVREQTARRLAEIAEAQVSTLIESAADAILSTDAAGRICLVNARVEALFGYDRSELIGQSVDVLLPERLRDGHARHRAGFVVSATDRPMGRGAELWGQRRNGSEFPIDVSLGPVETPEGLRYFCVILDVSERKELERQKDQFVSIVSHELRTPLTPVIGLAQLLLTTPLNEQQQRMVETICRSGQNLLAIVNDLLDLSKLQGGHVTLEGLPVSIRDLVEDTVDPIGAKASDKGDALAWRVAPDVPTVVQADPTRLRQILANLLDNAVKFTSDGDIEVGVTCSATDGEGRSLRFTVRDSGIGMSASSAARIFEPFTQASDSTTRQYGGTGLGLAVCKQLAELMGGEIGVESVEGQGSTFWFTARVQDAVREKPDGTATPLAGRRLLVVDARPSTREMLAEQLREAGAAVQTAEQAAGAMVALRRTRTTGAIDAVVLDVGLAGGTSLSLARAIRRDPVLHATPVLIVTASRESHALADLDHIGVQAVLRRPVRRAELCDAILRAIGAVSAHAGDASVLPLPVDAGGPKVRASVLVVDDSPMNQMVVLGFLDKLGYQGRAVDSGYAALDALAGEHPYAAVLMDCQMPGLDGYATTRELRDREGEWRRVPVLAMTASAMSGTRDECLRAGMDDYLTKPIQPEEFEAALARWVQPEAVPHGVDSAPDVLPATAPSTRPLLDTSMLELLASLPGPDGQSMLEKVIEVYCLSAPTHLESLRQQLASHDLASLGKTAHRVAGESAALGLVEASQVARSLEEMCGLDAPSSAVDALVQRLISAVENGIPAIEQYRQAQTRVA